VPVLLRFTDSDYPFGIFKFFLSPLFCCNFFHVIQLNLTLTNHISFNITEIKHVPSFDIVYFMIRISFDTDKMILLFYKIFWKIFFLLLGFFFVFFKHSYNFYQHFKHARFVFMTCVECISVSIFVHFSDHKTERSDGNLKELQPFTDRRVSLTFYTFMQLKVDLYLEKNKRINVYLCLSIVLNHFRYIIIGWPIVKTQQLLSSRW
jgi:hypothetical protein